MFVLTRKHERYYDDALAGVSRANLIVQPKNAGTAPAILYSLLRLEQIDPAGTVAFFPSDHYFSDDAAFMAEVDLALNAARRQADLVMLLGIEPEGPDEEYGWIEPEREISKDIPADFYRVRCFWEKPAPWLARDLMARGCLWNSFVMVGTVTAFLKMIRLATSELYAKLAVARPYLSTPAEENAIRNLYSDLSETNFSSEVLQARPGDLAVVRVGASKWSDLGSPRRVLATLSSLRDASPTRHEPAAAHFVRSLEGHYEHARVRSSEVV
jgi:mannose-1-phosphate guanylyltransferase